MKKQTLVRDATVMLLALFAAYAMVMLTQAVMGRIEGVAMLIFMLAVFVTSMYTEGYAWGVAASLISVLAVNFAFLSPYFAFNFTLSENLFSGLVMLVVSIMTSTLTTRIKKQEQLRMESEKEKMRANLLRAVSHDLRTPLTSIYGACSTVIENYDSLDKEKTIKLLGEACSDAQWLTRMVENLLSVTRIDSEKVTVQKTPTVLDELLDTVLVKFRKRYPEIPVELETPDAFIVIPMDSMLIQQVLMNLLENAALHAEGMYKTDPEGVHSGQSRGVRGDGQWLRHPQRTAENAVLRHRQHRPGCAGRQPQARHGHRLVGVRSHHQGPRRRDQGREPGGRGNHHPLLAGDRRSGYGGNRG